ncbi:hypothetical protein QF015_002311 [Paenarthrobacter sp. TE4293]|uniref:PASTA domain-containing protein n=1 Tax=Paenarthrobacter sp. TE4293 TaxID=3381695 RepID=UPI003D1C9193
MKKTAALTMALVIGAALAGCSGGSSEATQAKPSETAASSPATKLTTVPDIAGKPFADAKAALAGAGLTISIVGPDGTPWTTLEPGQQVAAVSTDPSAGSETDAKAVKLVVDTTEVDQQIMNDAIAAADGAVDSANTAASDAAAAAEAAAAAAAAASAAANSGK